MATLLHIDSAISPAGSASREVTAAFVKAWSEAHPDGKVVHRDLGAHPVPHLDFTAVSAAFSDPAEHTEEQRAAVALRDELATELESADAVLIGAPMYNFTIPSTLKAWLDQVIIVGRTGGESRTVVEIRSSGSDVDNFIVSTLQKAVRVDGRGDVQLLLGQN